MTLLYFRKEKREKRRRKKFIGAQPLHYRAHMSYHQEDHYESFQCHSGR